MKNNFTILKALLGLLVLVHGVLAGVELEKNGATEEERQLGIAMIASGSALMATLVGIPAGIALVAADNEDGTRSCWMKVLDSTDIQDEAAYNKYKALGLPVDELLKHSSAAIHPPNRRGGAPRVIVRNRRAEHFHLRPSGSTADMHMYHAEAVPKMITWPKEE